MSNPMTTATATRARIDRAYLEALDGRDLYELLDSCGVVIESVACVDFRGPRYRARVVCGISSEPITTNGDSFADALFTALARACDYGCFDGGAQ